MLKGTGEEIISGGRRLQGRRNPPLKEWD